MVQLELSVRNEICCFPARGMKLALCSLVLISLEQPVESCRRGIIGDYDDYRMFIGTKAEMNLTGSAARDTAVKQRIDAIVSNAGRSEDCGYHLIGDAN